MVHASDASVAVFTATNVCTTTMWYAAEDAAHPAYCMEYQSVPVFEHSPGNNWGDAGWEPRKLKPGESMSFAVRRERFSGPFRVGVWFWSEAEYDAKIQLIYWSEFVAP